MITSCPQHYFGYNQFSINQRDLFSTKNYFGANFGIPMPKILQEVRRDSQ